MESSAKYTLIGAALVAAIALITGAILWLSKRGAESNSAFYTIYFRNYSLSGLQVDGNVSVRGIKIGTVKSIQISPRDIELVKVVVQLAKGTPVKHDTRAVVQRNLLTGLASIDLIGGSQSAAFLSETPPDEDYPVIPEGKTDLQAIQNTLPEVLENANKLLRGAEGFFSEENQKSLTKILSNLEAVSGSLREKDQDLKDLISGLAKFSNTANGLLDTLSSQTGAILDAVRALVSQIGAEIRALTHQMNLVADRVSRSAGSFENPREILFGPNPKSLGPGE